MVIGDDRGKCLTTNGSRVYGVISKNTYLCETEFLEMFTSIAINLVISEPLLLRSQHKSFYLVLVCTYIQV